MKMRPHRFRYRISSPLVAILLFPLLLTFAGCGAAKSGTLPTDAAVIPTVIIAANPASIAAGSSSSLTINATNATQVTVTGSDGSSYNLSATGGTQAVTPAATATYTATVTGTGGKASATATVTVTGPLAAAPAVSIAANPTSITPGNSSFLTVTTTNATAVTVTGSDGSSYILATSGGTQAVSPKATTTYTAKASGSGGNASATATVSVSKPSATTVTIVASPTSIAAGGILHIDRDCHPRNHCLGHRLGRQQLPSRVDWRDTTSHSSRYDELHRGSD
jgi:hypothetical protein